MDGEGNGIFAEAAAVEGESVEAEAVVEVRPGVGAAVVDAPPNLPNGL